MGYMGKKLLTVEQYQDRIDTCKKSIDKYHKEIHEIIRSIARDYQRIEELEDAQLVRTLKDRKEQEDG